MQLMLTSLVSQMHQSLLNNKLCNIIFVFNFQFWSCILTNIVLNFCTGGTRLHLHVVWALPQEKTPGETISPYKNKYRNGSTPISISQRMTSCAWLKEWASWRCLTADYSSVGQWWWLGKDRVQSFITIVWLMSAGVINLITR